MTTISRPRATDTFFIVSGVVVPGDQRGRLLGFPTANVPLGESGLADGVYAGTVVDQTDDSVHVAAVSIGRRASFYGRDGERLLEAHLLDYSGSLYGHTITVELFAKIRPQRRYRSTEALVEQLGRDVAATRRWIGEQPSSAPTGERRLPKAIRPHARKAANAGESDRIRQEREQRRFDAIARTIAEVDHAEVTYELVAERSRIPVAYLRWAYPSMEELLAVARGVGHEADPSEQRRV